MDTGLEAQLRPLRNAQRFRRERARAAELEARWAPSMMGRQVQVAYRLPQLQVVPAGYSRRRNTVLKMMLGVESILADGLPAPSLVAEDVDVPPLPIAPRSMSVAASLLAVLGRMCHCQALPPAAGHTMASKVIWMLFLVGLCISTSARQLCRHHSIALQFAALRPRHGTGARLSACVKLELSGAKRRKSCRAC